MEVAYGGSHGSQPLISRYGVTAGDTLYTVRVHQGVLWIVGGMKVTGIVPWLDYAAHHLGVARAWLDATATCDDIRSALRTEHPEWGHRLPWGCTVEAVTGTGGAPLTLDRPVPRDIVEHLWFVPKSGPERRFKQVKDGRITSIVGLQDHAYRLRADCAERFRSLTWPGTDKAS